MTLKSHLRRVLLPKRDICAPLKLYLSEEYLAAVRKKPPRIGWEEKRAYIQPSEFLFRRNGEILQSSYSSGPLARTLPEDVVALLGFLLARERKKN